MKLKLNPDARTIYKQILKEIVSKMQLEDSKKYLEKFYPVTDRNEIIRRQKYLKNGFTKVDSLKKHLSGIKRIKFKLKYFSDRILFVEEKNYEKALKLGVCKVEKSYDNYLVIGRSRFDLEKLEPYLIVPECYVQTLLENKRVLESLTAVSQKVHGKSIIPRILDEISKVEEIFLRKKKIEELDEIVLRKKEELNKKIEEVVKNHTLTLSG
ncbi:endonuclease MutS2, partial [Candidatus Bathyarchaeota archaeon]